MIFLIPVMMIHASCKKDWLDAKPNKSLVVPSTIADYQALLDNTAQFSSNSAPFNSNQNALGEVGVGDYYVDNATWTAQVPFVRNTYIWAADIYAGAINIDDWDIPYKRIFYTNVVLEGIEKVVPADKTQQAAWNNVKGSALFFRAYNHYDVAQEFCKSYDKNTASNDPGIPLRLVSDFNQHSIRNTVQETYDQIIQDLKAAKSFLPVTLPDNMLHKLRPTKVAANAMLARVYLSMEDYDNALLYADSSLQLYNSLVDYNTLDSTYLGPFDEFPFNDEVIFNTTLNDYGIFFGLNGNIDTTLYQSYDANDLRKGIFFTASLGPTIFQGSYFGFGTKFSGLATDEMYLIRAECYARQGKTSPAMQDLNTLLAKRWEAGTFSMVTATDANDALAKIIKERRKEFIFRGLRWTDLRRLNKDPRFSVTLTRKVNGQTYTLPPNDPRYVLPIPDDVIRLSGITQNQRE